METLLTIEPGMLIWTMITFGLLLFILKKVAWGPLLTALSSREERIAQDVQRSEAARIEAERLLAEHQKSLSHAELEARKIIDDARKAADALRQEIVDHAQEQARQMTAQAKAEIQREKDTALAQLRTEVADLAILAAGKILGEELDATKHRALIDGVISDLPKN